MPVGSAPGLITRCPHCATAFRAGADQLAARHGQVRCGRCGQVFDARRYAVPEPAGEQPGIAADSPPPAFTSPADDEPLYDATSFIAGPLESETLPGAVRDAIRGPKSAQHAEPAAEPPAHIIELIEPVALDGAPKEEPLSSGLSPAVESGPEAPTETDDATPAWELEPVATTSTGAEPDPAEIPELKTPAVEAKESEAQGEAAALAAADSAAEESEAAAEAADSVPPKAPIPAERGASPTPARSLRAGEPPLDFGRNQPARKRLGLWWSIPVALLLVLVLAGQVAYYQRASLMVLFPGLRPEAEKLCARAGCELPYPRRAEMMSIESSALAADPNNPAVMVLSATLRNRAPFPQAQPALELTLTDSGDQALARRVLTPADYGAGGRAFFPAESELPIKLYFDASAVKATGYRLYLFYP
jgi:predicted Zn finger-like uncharacterized protein